MNIKEVYLILRNEIPNIDFAISKYTGNEKYDYIFTDMQVFSRAFLSIKEVAPILFTPQMEEILMPLVKRGFTYTTYSTYKKEGDPIIQQKEILYLSAKGFLDYIEPMVLLEEKENSIDIKLIHIKTLEDLESSAKLLKRAFNIPAFELDQQVLIGDIKTGSLWIELIAGVAIGGSLLGLFANLIWSAVAIKNKIKEAEYAEEHMRTIKIKNDLLEGLAKHHVEYIKQVKDAEAQHIINEYMAGRTTPDLQNNIKGSIEAISELIDKGAQFYPSIKAPEEIKMLFPNFAIKELLESKINLLSEGKTDKVSE